MQINKGVYSIMYVLPKKYKIKAHRLLRSIIPVIVHNAVQISYVINIIITNYYSQEIYKLKSAER